MITGCVQSVSPPIPVVKVWGGRGGTQFSHLQFLVQSVLPPQISKKRRGTLRRTLRYADMLIIVIIMTVSRIIDRHNT